MPSPRRSAIVAVLVLLAGLAFAGCGRAQPGTAAYVGDVRITERRVDGLVEEIKRFAEGRDTTGARRAMVSILVMRELVLRAAAERSIPAPEPDLAGTARNLGLPADAEVVRLQAELVAVGRALIMLAEPVQPTDEDFREIYDSIRTDPDFDQANTYEEIAEDLRANPALPKSLGARKILVEQAKKDGLEVNPRYRPLVRYLEAGVPLVMSEGIGVRDQVHVNS